MLIHIDRRTGKTAQCSDPFCSYGPHACSPEAAQNYRLRLLGLGVLTGHEGDELAWEFRPF